MKRLQTLAKLRRTADPANGASEHERNVARHMADMLDGSLTDVERRMRDLTAAFRARNSLELVRLRADEARKTAKAALAKAEKAGAGVDVARAAFDRAAAKKDAAGEALAAAKANYRELGRGYPVLTQILHLRRIIERAPVLETRPEIVERSRNELRELEAEAEAWSGTNNSGPRARTGNSGSKLEPGQSEISSPCDLLDLLRSLPRAESERMLELALQEARQVGAASVTVGRPVAWTPERLRDLAREIDAAPGANIAARRAHVAAAHGIHIRVLRRYEARGREVKDTL